ncbi:MAG: sugar ABC transporter ATP-binding protein [Ilumatobacteraceae bacterium]
MSPALLPATPVVAVEGLTKRYGGVTVLDHVDLQVRAGVVRALLGENGAGKSTLIKILSGVVRSDEGTVTLDGSPVEIHSAHAAQELGVATLHQELAIVPGLSVAENIFLGQKRAQTLGVVRWGRLRRDAQDILASLGQRLNVRQDASKLSPVGKTMTAIARALSRDARVLILDEPTAALTDQETAQMFSAMRRLQERGVAIIYVSHRLEEVVQVCDTYTVLRNGQKVAEGSIADVSIPGIITAMAGRPVDTIFPARDAAHGEVLMRVSSLSGRRCRDVSFELRAGEVVGIAGLAGSGRSEVVRLLAGAQHRRSGSLEVCDTAAGGNLAPVGRRHSIGRAQRLGIALVPQERRTDGLVPDSVERNINLTTLGRHALARVVMQTGRSRAHAERRHGELAVRSRGIAQQVFRLSGGNQQKVVLAKFWALSPRILLLDEPTRGVDVGTKSEIYHLVRRRAGEGAGVVVVSSELPELLGLCDRIMVMHEGRVIGTYDATVTDEDELLHACYGRSQ